MPLAHMKVTVFACTGKQSDTDS